MSRKKQGASARTVGRAEQLPETFLTQLYALYGHTHLAPDALGRRDALPSEIARVLTRPAGAGKHERSEP